MPRLLYFTTKCISENTKKNLFNKVCVRTTGYLYGEGGKKKKKEKKKDEKKE